MADKSSSAFTSLVYTILIAEERGSVKDVAAMLGLKEQSLYSRIYGRVRFSADEARELLRAVPDSRLADYLLDGTAFTAVLRDDIAPGDHAETARIQAERTVLHASDVMREVAESLADDGRIDHIEQARIEERIVEAMRALNALKKLLEHG